MKYFTIKEMCVSGSYPKLVEIPASGSQVERNLTYLIEKLLDPIRAKIGKPMKVTSGYRPNRLNTAVKGAKNSNHLYGYAADVITGNGGSDNLKIVYALLELGIPFDECIIERGTLQKPQWIHLAVKPSGNRKRFSYSPSPNVYLPVKYTKEVNYKLSV